MQRLMKAMHKNEKGFTLVELMVVVVIIGILVAIAIPIYASIQETAQIRAFEANHRILVGGIQVFAAENDGAYPSQGTDIDIYIDGTLADMQGSPVGATYVYTVTSDEPTLTSTFDPHDDSPLTYSPLD